MSKRRCVFVVMGLIAWLGLRVGFRSPSPATVPSGMASTAVTVSAIAASPADDWPARYLAASPSTRSALVAEGLRWAEARRVSMLDAIRRDPQAALAAALPYEVRSALPPDVAGRIEQPVSGVGTFEVAVACDFADDGHRDLPERFVELDGRRYQVHTYGRRLDVTTKRALWFHGVAVDDQLAMHEDPVRAVQPEEATARALAVTGAVAEVAGAFHAAGEIAEWRAAALTAEGAVNPDATAASPGDEIALTSAFTEGAKTVLFICAEFADTPGWPTNIPTISNAMNVVTQFWRENSYEKTSVTFTYCTNLVTLTNNCSYYTNRFGTLLIDAANAAATQGFDSALFDHFVVLTRENTTNGGNFSYAGKAWIGAPGNHLVMPWYPLRTSGHELGHNFGLRHANYWRTDADWCIGHDSVPGGYVTDTNDDEWVEYGHRFTIMSGQSTTDMNDRRAHFAGREKYRLNWIATNEHVATVTGGTFRIYRHDHIAATNRLKSVNVDRTTSDYTGSGREFWLSYRRNFTNYDATLCGLHVDWVRSSYGTDGTIMLDMTPFSSDDNAGASLSDDNSDKQDGALPIGRTFSDPLAGIHITPTAVGGTSPDEWIDVTVNIGSFPSNRPPTLVLTAATNAAATSTWIPFAAEASDPDGDPLAYSWDFMLPSLVVTNALNRPTCSNRWTTAGEYVVRCTVSDLRGGVNSTSVLVRIGTVTNLYRLEGRVWWNGLTGGVEGVRVYVSHTNSAWTLSDGSFILPNRKASTNVVLAMRYGLRPAASFPTSIVVGATVTNLDFAFVTGTGVRVEAEPGASLREGTSTSVLVRLVSPPTALVSVAASGDTNLVAAGAAAVLGPTNWIQGARLGLVATDDTRFEPAPATAVVAHVVTSVDTAYHGIAVPPALWRVIDDDALVDNDGDGMIDAFEWQFAGDPTNVAASADADGDGFSNLGEYIAGTQPTNGASFLRLAGGPDFAVAGVSGRVYVVQAATTMDATNWADIATATGVGAPLLLTVTNDAPARFYRLDVRLP